MASKKYTFSCDAPDLPMVPLHAASCWNFFHFVISFLSGKATP